MKPRIVPKETYNLNKRREVTKQVYNNFAPTFETRSEKNIPFFTDYRNFFVVNLNGKKVLDIGSGTGVDAVFFKDKRLDVTCIDPSEEMVKRCQQKGLKVIQGYFEDYPFQENSFDGIWASASFIHLMRNEVVVALEKVKKILKPNGIFYISLAEGDSEVFIEGPEEGFARFFNLYSKEEADKLLLTRFAIIRYEDKIHFLDERGFLSYFLKNKKTR